MKSETALTFADLVQAEPRLGELLHELKKVRSRPGFCANATWYCGRPSYKHRMSTLVGWYRKDGKHPVLSTQAAFDVAYDELYAALPDCQHAGPFC